MWKVILPGVGCYGDHGTNESAARANLGMRLASRPSATYTFHLTCNGVTVEAWTSAKPGKPAVRVQ